MNKLKTCCLTNLIVKYVLLQVLWTLKEKRILDNLEELITDDLFELVYTWVKDVPESSLLKKSLDASEYWSFSQRNTFLHRKAFGNYGSMKLL